MAAKPALYETAAGVELTLNYPIGADFAEVRQSHLEINRRSAAERRWEALGLTGIGTASLRQNNRRPRGLPKSM